MSRLMSVVKLRKQFTFVFAASIVFCTVGSVYADWLVTRGGTWPKSWPKELEPLRKQASTWEHSFGRIHYEIPFANREEFESAWPHILKLKSKGASLTLSSGDDVGVKIIPPMGFTRDPTRRHPIRIELEVDGSIVDLNRIRLPADTPIIDTRFTENGEQKKKGPQDATEQGGAGPPAAPTTTTPGGGRLVVQPGPVTIEAASEKDAFAGRLKQRIQTVDFDDIDTSDTGPVPFDSDRYAASAGVIIKGTDGQYVDESFGWPGEFKPGSPPNMYAPGPPATDFDPPPRGGHRTEITFAANGSKAAVAGFGAVFIDADWPCIGPCTIRAFDPSGKELGSWSGFAGPNGSKLFRGIIAVNDKGDPVSAISRVEIINGDQWPSVDIGEGVTLDDFVFSAPVPMVNEARPEESH